MKKSLTKEDKKIWRLITKKIMPLDAARAIVPDDLQDFSDMMDETEAPKVHVKSQNQVPVRPIQTSIKKTKTEAQDVDTRTLMRLKKGQLNIDYTLDLHGHNLSDARVVLLSTLKNLHGTGGRCLLLIHGKGSITGVAKIKKTFPQWLDEVPSIVLSHAIAKPQHGGLGASYILLRRKRVT